MMQPVGIYEWVNDNNPLEKLSYRKGWWDYVEFLYELDWLYGENITSVVSTYNMTTPPPQETLLMPVARLETGRVSFIMKTIFEGIGENWTVSVIRNSSTRIPLLGLIDEHAELSPDKIDGFAPEWVFPCYTKSPGRFTCRIKDDWQLYTFMWVVTQYEGRIASDCPAEDFVFSEEIPKPQSDADRDRFIALLEEPPQPGAALRKAMRSRCEE